MNAVTRTGRRLGLGIALIAAIAIGNPAWAADDALRPYLEVRGLIDFRGVISSGTQSWEDGALGKTRYGGTANGKQRVLGNIAEATLLLEPHLFWDLTGFVQLTATPEAHVSPDVIEAFMHYKPVPSGPFGFRAKGGAFFPPFSIENTAIGWTSPYTISSSAINTWIGEELRTVGGEATAYYRSDDWEIEVTGSLFTANDPTGTLLAWRGWTISDRKAGFLDRLILPALPVIRPPSSFAKQSPYDQPFKELDNKVGYYIGGKIALPALGSLSVYRYDNRADDKVFEKGQWPWTTKFWSLGARAQFGAFDILAQGMTGKTTVVTLPAGPLVYSDFRSVYGLLSRNWGNHRLSLRYDWFETEGSDLFTPVSERGDALTVAYIYRPAARQRLTLEFLYIDSNHAERAALRLPVRAKETQFQISYRFFL